MLPTYYTYKGKFVLLVVAQVLIQANDLWPLFVPITYATLE